jgi:hypothetical protein
MKSKNLFGLVAVIAALHVAVLSFVFGPRHLGYILVAALSATLPWGVVFFLNKQKHRTGIIVGAVIGLVIQLVAYQIWKGELPRYWLALAQFWSLQFLVAYAWGKLHLQDNVTNHAKERKTHV